MSDQNKASKDVALRPCPFCCCRPDSHSYAYGGKSYAWVRCEPCNLRKELNTDGVGHQQMVLEAVARWWNGPVVETTTRRFVPGECNCEAESKEDDPRACPVHGTSRLPVKTSRDEAASPVTSYTCACCGEGFATSDARDVHEYQCQRNPEQKP